MRKVYCEECKVRMLVGDRLAMCERCGKCVDLRKGRPATYHHPLVVVALLGVTFALVAVIVLSGLP